MSSFMWFHARLRKDPKETRSSFPPRFDAAESGCAASFATRDGQVDLLVEKGVIGVAINVAVVAHLVLR
ncbi:hypothetical protein [Salinigranum salinum]|uniref:hypothetical protein n=1 Tax=Salinigranum salinum TaxID=1364937 RepID=UPI00126081F2|nr:hypothetical protein [Salinigranum salinum]